MATYTPTITTNARAEKGLDLELTRENVRRAALIPPQVALTKAQLVEFKIGLMLQSYGSEYVRTVRDLVGTATETASPAQLSNAATALGVTLP